MFNKLASTEFFDFVGWEEPEENVANSSGSAQWCRGETSNGVSYEIVAGGS